MNKCNTSRMLSLLLSDVDEGGAGIACQRVYAELNRRTSHQCGWVVASARKHVGATDASMWPSFPSLIAHELKRRTCKEECALARADHKFHEANIAKIARSLNPRSFYLHNIHQKASFDLLAALPVDTPILIFLHDMWYLTGYCCHSMDCDKFTSGCVGICPQWRKWEIPTRGADAEWQRRELFYSRNTRRIRVIAPSQWMKRCAEARFKGRIVVEHISNPLDTAVFRPIGLKREIRQMLGLDGQKPLILCGAITMKDQHKGFSYLKEALERLRQRLDTQFTVAVFGKDVVDGIVPGMVNLGAVRDERLLNLYYNAATVFALPSLAESFGLVFAEAMAAGTPCVAFDAAACGELVQEGKTGYLAVTSDVNSLTDALERAVKAGDNNPLSRICREQAVEKYDVRHVGEQHLKLIEKMVDDQV